VAACLPISQLFNTGLTLTNAFRHCPPRKNHQGFAVKLIAAKERKERKKQVFMGIFQSPPASDGYRRWNKPMFTLPCQRVRSGMPRLFHPRFSLGSIPLEAVGGIRRMLEHVFGHGMSLPIMAQPEF
jgi:hypothetical protein